MPLITTLKPEQIHSYVDYCAANLNDLSAQEGNELVSKLLRINVIYAEVYNTVDYPRIQQVL